MRLAKISLALVAVLILVGFSTLAIKSGAATHDINFNAPKLQSTEAKLKSVNIQYQKLNSKLDKQTSHDKKTIQTLKQQQDQLRKERSKLQQQVEARAQEKKRLQIAAAHAANTLTATSSAAADTPSETVSGCGDNSYAHYVYMHESGCSTTSENSGGCYGIGQDCNGVVRNRCGTSYGCQNDFFNDYAARRYGGWASAYQFWINHHWW